MLGFIRIMRSVAPRARISAVAGTPSATVVAAPPVAGFIVILHVVVSLCSEYSLVLHSITDT